MTKLPFAKRVLRKIETELTRHSTCRRTILPPDIRIVSFSFDDFPVSASATGAKILENYGFLGTFYASFGLAGTPSPSGPICSLEESFKLAERGHEIGCHTYSHVDCSLIDPEELEFDCKKNQRVGVANQLPLMSSFAYPFGGINRPTRAKISRLYASGRTVWEGINRGHTDAPSLSSVALIESSAKGKARRYINDLLDRGGWLIFYTHDVARDPSKWGCSPHILEEICGTCARDGLKVLPVREVLQSFSRQTIL